MSASRLRRSSPARQWVPCPADVRCPEGCPMALPVILPSHRASLRLPLPLQLRASPQLQPHLRIRQLPHPQHRQIHLRQLLALHPRARLRPLPPPHLSRNSCSSLFKLINSGCPGSGFSDLGFQLPSFVLVCLHYTPIGSSGVASIIRVPHPCGDFVLAARVGWAKPQAELSLHARRQLRRRLNQLSRIGLFRSRAQLDSLARLHQPSPLHHRNPRA